jgi:hypothetical protein
MAFWKPSFRGNVTSLWDRILLTIIQWHDIKSSGAPDDMSEAAQVIQRNQIVSD